jgi:vacuolar-type H+-ATPase subunit H
MTENTKYLDELLLSYKQTIHELKQSNKDLKDIIDKLLHNHHKNVKECHDDTNETNETNTMKNESEYDDGDDNNDDNSESEEENENVYVNQSINSQTLQDIFKIVDEYNQSRSVKSFPSYEYFKNRGITRYMISKENGLKRLRQIYFESRTFT